jgi:DNA processing protein
MVPEVGPLRFARLVEHFGSADAAFGAGAAALRMVDGIGQATADTIARGRAQASVEKELALAEKHGVRIICREDQEYPRPLKFIPDPPICLYVRGKLEPQDAVAMAVVGSRRCTIYGREQANRFGYQLAQRGLTVISGLARGVDGEAHKGAISAEGRTIAILGNGLTKIYPPEHADLAGRVLEHGAIISELPMATSPDKNNFLPRNRIIAGLSLGTLVIEAARRSGSLSTARCASEYNREVFAVPGRIDSDFSSGTNALIRDQHAKLVTCPDDVLDELGEAGELLRRIAGGAGDEHSPALCAGPDGHSVALRAGSEPPGGLFAAPAPKLNDDERTVHAALRVEERSLEQLCEDTGLPAAKVASTLIMLQLKGMAKQLPGGLFVRPGRA